MTSTAAFATPLTLTQMKDRLNAIEAEVQLLRDEIELAESVAALDEAKASAERGEGLPGQEALDSLRVELGLPPRAVTGLPEAER